MYINYVLAQKSFLLTPKSLPLAVIKSQKLFSKHFAHPSGKRQTDQNPLGQAIG